MTTQTTITNVRYYNSKNGIIEAVFSHKYRSPRFCYELRYADGTSVNDHLRPWLKMWHPEIWRDILNDPLE